MNEPLVSFIVPTYNTNINVLEQTLVSLSSQSISHEIIIIDDGSNNSNEIISLINNLNDSTIKYYKNSTNLGLSSSRNRGIRKAAGRYISFIDSDDLLSNKFSDINLSLLNDEKTIVCFSDTRDYDFFCSNNDLLFHNELENKKNYYIFYKNDCCPLLNHFSACEKIYPRELLIANNVHFLEDHQSIGEDIIFLWQLYPYISKIVYINKPLYYYRISEDSITNGYKKGVTTKYLSCIHKLNNIAWDNDFVSQLHFNIVNTYLFNIFKLELFNPCNPKKFSDKKRELKKLAKEPTIKNAINSSITTFVDKRKRLVLLLLKNKFYFLTTLLLNVRYLKKYRINR